MLLLALSLLMNATPAGFSRNQDRAFGLTRWGSQVVVLTARPCVLDVGAASCKPVKVPGLDEVRVVAGDTTRFAVGKAGGKTRVLREHAGTWRELESPALGGDWEAVTAGASGERLALVWSIVGRSVEGRAGPPAAPRAEAGLALWDGVRWSFTRLELGLQGLPHLVRFIGGRWLFGYSGGEWGGSLWTLDAKGAAVRLLPDLNQPVNALVPLPNGSALVGTGLSHMGLFEAEVGVLAPDGSWTRLAKVDVARATGVNWTLKADSLEGADVDAAGRVYVWTGSQGVARLDGESMVVVTPGWPKDQHVYGVGMLLEGDLAVLATFDAGVLLWKLGTASYRRVPLLKAQQ